MADTETLQNRPDATGMRDPVTRWLFLVAFLVVLMVVIGGYTRLSRAGLSITEWDVVTGMLPPIGQDAWEESFDLYKQTPEYQLVNAGMTLSEYKQIFYIEWVHRFVGRIAGMLVVLPLIWFMVRKIVTPRESIKYWLVAAGFGVQGAIGWVMVASGLEDRPAVSEMRLTIHLLAALTLLGVILWMAMHRLDAQAPTEARFRPSSALRAMVWVTFAAVIVQIAWGGLVAGLKAGYLSDTWPMMYGYLVPPGLLSTADSFFMSLFEPLTSHWIHRWFAFVVLGLSIAVLVLVSRGRNERPVRSWSLVLVVVTGLQITLGVSVVLLGMPKYFALAHQALGIAVFCASLVVCHTVEACWTTTPEREGSTV